MTSNTDKLRAVFLTALMIGSVFAAGVAFTGGAAADATGVSATTVDREAGDTTTDVTVNYGAGNDSVAYVISADTSYDSGTDLYASSDSADGTSTTFSGVDVSSLDAGTYNVYAVANNTTSPTSEPAASEPTDGDDLTSWSNTDNTFDIQSPSDDTSFNDGGIVFQGQTASYDAEAADGDFGSQNGYTLYERTDSSTGAPVRELNEDSGWVNATTSGLDTGTTYFISNNGQNPSNADINFTIREQNFDVAFDGDETANDDTDIDVTFESTNRQNVRYNVTITSENLDDSELEEIFDDLSEDNSDFIASDIDVNDDDDDEDDGIALKLPSGGDVTAGANFSTIDAGEYEFSFEVSDTTASDTETLNVTEAAEANTEFIDVESVARGDVSTFNVSLTGTKTATLTIGTPSQGYQANVTVQDGNGDGYVAFDANTYKMAGKSINSNADLEPAFSVVNDDDSIEDVELANGQNIESPLDNGNYRTTVRSGPDANNTADDKSRLSITDNTGISGQNIWTAPGAIDKTEDVLDAATQDSSIVKGDYIVHEIQAQGIFGILADADSDLGAVISNGDLDLSTVQTDDSTQLNRNQKEINYSSGTTYETVSDAENNTLYIAVSTDNLNVTRNGDKVTDNPIDFGNDVFNTTVTLTESSDLVDENVSQSAEFSAEEIDHGLNQDTYNLTNAENQTITGYSNAAEGTDYNILVESTNTEGDGFIEPTNPATVDADGELSAEIDLSDASVGDEFEVVLEDPDADTADDASGTIVEEAPTQPTDSTTDEPTDTTTDEPTDTTTAEPTDTTTAESTTMEATDTTEDTDSSGGDIPGFTTGIALVAILGAALLALRE
ncbi:DUF7827 domain-containing protein [Halobacterium jilantaiense]|uniref:PGF-CTERM protein/surface glycoprotein n=1 Tax=Halobacterium jilantaiense TaxID=355548 RepID=A0A1I0P8H1_9EURY|nr:BGTF surface domain-containing protein [Halobacterium jilantaiense]SEW10570.1 PGF-CTERM protein/surface glycoprotein [Halobacterium jilantaiense]